MFLSLALIAVIGLLVWFTMDASAVLHVPGVSGRYMAIPVRAIPTYLEETPCM